MPHDVFYTGLAMMAGMALVIVSKRTRLAGWLLAVGATCIEPLFRL